MSYDVDIKDSRTSDTFELSQPHLLRGGTYTFGGTTSATLNVTYNYAPYFREVFGEEGLRELQGLSLKSGLMLIQEGFFKLKGTKSSNYWDSTEGNAKASLGDLVMLAMICCSEADEKYLSWDVC